MLPQAQAGTIRIITNKPDTSGFDMSVDAELNAVRKGDFGGSLEGMVNLPLNDMTALRVLPPHDYVAATDTTGEVVELAKGIEGLKRQWGVHAAGVIMSSEPRRPFSIQAVAFSRPSRAGCHFGSPTIRSSVSKTTRTPRRRSAGMYSSAQSSWIERWTTSVVIRFAICSGGTSWKRNR